MAEYIVTDTDMISLADTIRAKGGTSSPLTFPTGMKNAVNAIPTGSESPTLHAPSANGGTFQTYVDDADNGLFSEYYNIYSGANDEIVETIVRTNSRNYIGQNITNYPIGGNQAFYIKAFSTLFNPSEASQTFNMGVYTVTKNLTNCTESSGITKYISNRTFTLSLTADQGYILPDSITVIVQNVTYTLTNNVRTKLSQYEIGSFAATYFKGNGNILFECGLGNNNIIVNCQAIQAGMWDVDFEVYGIEYGASNSGSAFIKLNSAPTSAADCDYVIDLPYAGGTGSVYMGDELIADLGYGDSATFTETGISDVYLWADTGGNDDFTYKLTSSGTSTNIPDGYTNAAVIHYTANGTLYIGYKWDE